MKPPAPETMVAIEKAEAPPPEGSTATKKCCVLTLGLRTSYGIGGHLRAIISSTSLAMNAFSEPSAEMPSDSRSSMAGSSAKSLRTVLPSTELGRECATCAGASCRSTAAGT